MDFYEVINKRRTIRDFENTTIDDFVMKRVLEAGFKAPTNDHMRDWHFIVIRDKSVVEELLRIIPRGTIPYQEIQKKLLSLLQNSLIVK